MAAQAELRALSRQEAHRLRLQAQGLGVGRSGALVDVVREAGAIQAQDRLAETVAIGVRSSGLSAELVGHARNVDRSLARSWLMRGTLHLVPAEDLRWMLEVLGERIDAKALKRRQDLGISTDDHERVLEFLRAELAVRGPMTRPEIAEALRSAGLPWEGQATPHLMRTATLLGIMCYGPDRDGESTHVLIGDWLPDGFQPSDPGAELARRYFSAYGPSTAPDYRWWSGLPASDARRGMQSITDELIEIVIDGRSMWMSRDAAARVDKVLEQEDQVLRVLGPFDPYVLGYAKRDLLVPAPYLKRINAGGGMIRSCVLIDGRLVGTWERRRRSHSMTVTVTAFELLSDDALQQMDSEFGEIGRFLGTEITWSVQFDDQDDQ